MQKTQVYLPHKKERKTVIDSNYPWGIPEVRMTRNDLN